MEGKKSRKANRLLVLFEKNKTMENLLLLISSQIFVTGINYMTFSLYSMAQHILTNFMSSSTLTFELANILA